MKAGVLTVSDGCARGEREDVSGRVLAETLEANGYAILARGVVPDEPETVTAPARVVAYLFASLGVYRKAQLGLVGLGLWMDLAQVREDGVGCGDLFWGRLFFTFLG